MKTSTQSCALSLALSLIFALPYAVSQTEASVPTSPSIAAASAPTAVPPLVSYDGVALGPQGKSLGSPASVTFLIYGNETGGEPLFAETQAVTVDPSGHYRVQLGATLTAGLPIDIFSTGEARWLEVQIAGQTPPPRVLIASVPYALKAADAETLGGLPASAFVLAGQSPRAAAVPAGITPDLASNVTTTGGTSGYVPVFSGTATVVDSPIFILGAKTGIGTAAPSQTLDVNGATAFRGNANFFWNGGATPSGGANSSSLTFSAESYDSKTASVIRPYFSLLAEAAGNNTASPSATLNLQYSNGTTLAETGLHINSNGTINFAPGQTFSGAGITGTVNASGYDLDGYRFDTASAATASVFLGFAGNGNSTGVYNLGVGPGALNSNTTGTYNTASGENALDLNTTGTSNTASGVEALASNTTGSYNTASGFAALYLNTIGYQNTALGYAAGPDSSALADSTAIGSDATVSQGNSLVLGQTTGGLPGASYVNVGIGTATPRSILEAAADLKGGLGPVLTLTNSGGSGEAAIDVNTYLPSSSGTYNPAARIEAVDDNWADDIFFEANTQGGPNQGLRATMIIYPDGDVDVVGTLSAASKDFKIDHPLDPENKYLVHSSVESSEMINVYSGNVVTDELGLATVKLPDWFEAENGDFRYQLTVIGQFAQAIVKDKVANGQFRIMTNASHVEVSWQITAVRQDAYAKSHPLIVEQDKPASERGHTLDKPLLHHDQPASAVNKHFPAPAPPSHMLPRLVNQPPQAVSQLQPK